MSDPCDRLFREFHFVHLFNENTVWTRAAPHVVPGPGEPRGEVCGETVTTLQPTVNGFLRRFCASLPALSTSPAARASCLGVRTPFSGARPTSLLGLPTDRVVELGSAPTPTQPRNVG